jgi:myosin heavy subunit
VSTAAALLGVADETLVLALVKREMKVGTETMVKDVSAEKASEARDALARGVYDRMFGWLIEKVRGGACVRQRGAPMVRPGASRR